MHNASGATAGAGLMAAGGGRASHLWLDAHGIEPRLWCLGWDGQDATGAQCLAACVWKHAVETIHAPLAADPSPQSLEDGVGTQVAGGEPCWQAGSAAGEETPPARTAAIAPQLVLDDLSHAKLDATAACARVLALAKVLALLRGRPWLRGAAAAAAALRAMVCAVADNAAEEVVQPLLRLCDPAAPIAEAAANVVRVLDAVRGQRREAGQSGRGDKRRPARGVGRLPPLQACVGAAAAAAGVRGRGKRARAGNGGVRQGGDQLMRRRHCLCVCVCKCVVRSLERGLVYVVCMRAMCMCV